MRIYVAADDAEHSSGFNWHIVEDVAVMSFEIIKQINDDYPDPYTQVLLDVEVPDDVERSEITCWLDSWLFEDSLLNPQYGKVLRVAERRAPGYYRKESE